MERFEANSISAITVVISVPVLGGAVEIAWGSENGLIAIRNLDRGFTFAEFQRFAEQLQGKDKQPGGAITPAATTTVASADTQVSSLAETHTRAVERLVADPTKGNGHKTGGFPPRGTLGTGAPAKTPVEPEEKPVTVAPQDYAVFTRLQKLADIVSEIVRRGAKTYDEIRKYVQDLDDTEQCPALDRIKQQGDLEQRLRTHCASRGIEGAV